jgi:hypothetical protein
MDTPDLFFAARGVPSGLAATRPHVEALIMLDSSALATAALANLAPFTSVDAPFNVANKEIAMRTSRHDQPPPACACRPCAGAPRHPSRALSNRAVSRPNAPPACSMPDPTRAKAAFKQE